MGDEKNKYLNLSAGDATPYWYEWYVGLKYIVELIAPSTSIESVTFQSSESQKLDDVVISYKDGIQKCIQVKNTRENNKIGFQTFINNKDYLRAFAKEWKTLRERRGGNVRIQFFSNREASGSYYGNKNLGKYERPPLDEFWKYLRKESCSENVKSISDISMEEKKEWITAWGKCQEALESLNDNDDDLRLEFIKNFDIRLGEKDFLSLEEEIILSIKDKYHLEYNQSKRVFEDLIVELRKWTTKEWKEINTEKITQKDVINALFGRANQSVSDHHIPITANFFESRKTFVGDFIETINNTSKKVVFLSGKPNVGKTTIISYLYNGYENVIDFRFYSFKPITVDSKYMGADKGNSSHRGLWGDLFIQIFEFIRNSYEDYSDFNIIPYIEWMDNVKLQAEVLRLLGEIASNSDKKIVVAIDGIDHAARSKDKDNYLESMCVPSNIPDNVCFIIAGQTVDGYINEYPSWLRDEDSVEHCYVPDISEQDIIELYNGYGFDEGLYPKSVMVKYITKISNGNTLTAVLAFKEAEKCIDISDLEKKLEERKLSDNVEQYYEEVWSHCTGSFEVLVKESIEIKLACVLSYSVSRVKSELLAEIFHDMNLSPEDWKFLLRKVFPLVSEQNDGFAIDINDVRVFLKKKVNSCFNKESLDSVKLELGKYYFKSDDCIRERHFVAYDLLKGTDHEYVLAENCNSNFIIEAFSLNQPIVEIRNQIDFAIQLIIKSKRWDTVKDIFCAIRTLCQYNKTLQWEDRVYHENKCSKNLFKSEILSAGITYEYRILKEIIKDATELFEFDSLSRAKEVLNIHFGSKDISRLSEIFVNVEEKKTLSDSRKDLIYRLGSIARYCEFELGIEKDISDLTSKDEIFLNNYLKGWFKASSDFERVNINNAVVEKTIIPTGEVLFNYLVALSKRNYWTNIFEITSRFDLLSLNPVLVVQIVSWYVQRNRVADIEEIKGILISEGLDFFNDVNWKEEYPTSYKLKAYCNILFIHGFFGTNIKNMDSIVNKIYPFFDESEQAGVKYFLLKYHALGISYRGNCNTKTFEKDYEDTMKEVLNFKRRHISSIMLNDIIHDLIVKIINFGEVYDTSNLGEITFKSISGKLDDLIASDLWDYLYSPIIVSFLSDRGETRKLRRYIKKVCGTKSDLWKISVSDRNAIIESIYNNSKVLNMEQSFLMYLKDWNEWFSIGYSGHKEYILYDLVEWLEVLLIRKPLLWKKYIYQVVNISEVVHKFADNRVGLDFEYIFAEAAFKESKSALACMLNVTRIPYKDKIFVLSNLTRKLLEGDRINLDEAVVLWNFIVFHLQYENTYDKQELAELKEEIAQYLDRHSFDNEKLSQFKNIDKNYTQYANIYYRGNKNDEEGTNNVKSIDELETEFDEGKQNWEECLLYINHLKVKRPQNTRDYVERIIKLLEKRKAMYEWKGDGIYEVYQAVFPLIDDSTIWRIFKNSIARLEDELNVERWAELVADRIMNLSIFNAEYNTIEEIEQFVERIIDMHLRFISGNYRFNYVSNATAQFSNDINTWDELFKTLTRD